MVPRPVRGLLFIAIALAFVIPPAVAGRGGRRAAVAVEAAAPGAVAAALGRRWRRRPGWRRWRRRWLLS